MSNNQLTLIRGTTGVGKSTLGCLLRADERIDVVIDIDSLRKIRNSDKFEYNLNTDYLITIDMVVEIVKNIPFDSGIEIVLIDVFSTPILRRLSSGIPLGKSKCVTLYCETAVLTKRMNSRASGYVNAPVACRVQRSLLENSFTGDTILDVTHLSPPEVSKKVTLEIMRL